MIALNTAKGIIEINSWKDIIERPHFRSDINPASKTLRKIIGSYHFPENVACGLTTCHQPHKRGYIVMTKEGFETNIGKDCGKSYFSVDFVDMKTRFNKDVKIYQQRENVKRMQNKASELLAVVNALRKQPKGADWIYTNIEKLRQPDVVGEKATFELRKMIKERRKVLISPREATKEERESAFAMNPSLAAKLKGDPYYIDVVVGSIEFLDAMYKENDLKEILIRDVTRVLKRLLECDVDNVKTRDLAQLSKDASGVEAKIDMAKSIIPIGQKFLTDENLSPLAGWIESHFGERATTALKLFIECIKTA
ncbi:hypothetical protein CYR40_00140 [Chimaeribacter arupi]|uniref:hypothetical protein n=1 Tax=Chimaeribacter arupi TaxID=2060066 RepID=UPI000C7DE35B|nr:hypothetical protein [Chimaeribacter arupi]PLR50763.1 hypothetical protein CYR40_00140 [Chimaeribacter arupi]